MFENIGRWFGSSSNAKAVPLTQLDTSFTGTQLNPLDLPYFCAWLRECRKVDQESVQQLLEVSPPDVLYSVKKELKSLLIYVATAHNEDFQQEKLPIWYSRKKFPALATIMSMPTYSCEEL